MTEVADLQWTKKIVRKERREPTVQIVEYSRYPRRLANENRHVAYTVDRSKSGLCLDLGERVFPGELLRITLCDIDSTVSIDGLARVVWCRESQGDRTRAGLSILREDGDRPMMRVRHMGERSLN